MLHPTKKRYPTSKGKEKPQKEERRGKIVFRLKSHTHQRCSEGSDKTLSAPGSRDPTETEPDLCLSLLWRYGSAVACRRGRGSGCSRPGSRPHCRQILYQLRRKGSPKHTFISLHITSSCTKLLEVVNGSCITLFVLLHTLLPLPRTPVVLTNSCHSSKLSLEVIPQRWLVPLLCTSTHS